MEKQIDYIELIKDCSEKRLVELGLNNDPKYTARFEQEIKDLADWKLCSNANMARKLWNLKNKGTIYNTNRSGSIILFLLNISNVDPIKNEIKKELESLVEVSCPDIDTDFDPRCREWVKKKIVEIFSEEKTCSIGTFQTYKTKAVIVDVARALGLDINAVHEITTEIDSLEKHEQENGEESVLDKMSWDEIFEIYPLLKTYMEENPEVYKHCKVLRNQVKNMGKHAGGMVISSIDLQGKIPVIKDKKSGQIISSWCESGGSAELTEVGLVKVDVLGLSHLSIISDCVKLIKKTRGIKLTRADIPINDRSAIKFCAKEDLLGIFQFESSIAKQCADEIILESLEDLANCSSLLRPGPLSLAMPTEYAERKKGKKYSIPKCLESVLGNTLGILIFQEQCFSFDTNVYTTRGYEKIGKLVEDKIPTDVYCLDDNGDMVTRPVVQWHDNGKHEVFKYTFSDGNFLECTKNHRVLLKDGTWKEVGNLTEDDEVVTKSDLKIQNMMENF